MMNIKVIGLDWKAVSEDRGVHQLDNASINQLKGLNLVEKPQKTRIEPIYKNSTPALSMTSAIIHTDSKEVIGFINIVIKTSVFKSILHNAAMKIPGTYHIELENGNILFSSPEWQPIPSFKNRKQIEGKSSGYLSENGNLLVFQTSSITGWKVMQVVSLAEVRKETKDMKSLIILTVGSSIIFSILLYFFITSKFIHPLRILKEKMKESSQGNLNVQIINNGTDEIAELATSFNKMISKINLLLNDRVNEEKQLKIAELRTLQAQINPHFLYNTLETIIWMAEAKKEKKVIELTKALSQLFRISLSKGKDFIKIEEEINHIRNYLFIQEMRYQDILDVSYHINREILSCEIMKLTLQPLVENAIYHGIKNKRGKGFVRIKGDFTQEGNICIDIIDNGLGMNEDRLEEIRKQLNLGIPFEKDTGGFGLVNVHQRLLLHYGEPFGLSIRSWYGSGTRVSLIIPAKRC